MNEQDNRAVLYIAARQQTMSELDLAIDQATQSAPIYRNDRPIATAQRRRVLDKTAPDWSIYQTDGRKLFDLWIGGPNASRKIIRRLAAHIVHQEHGL